MFTPNFSRTHTVSGEQMRKVESQAQALHTELAAAQKARKDAEAARVTIETHAKALKDRLSNEMRTNEELRASTQKMAEDAQALAAQLSKYRVLQDQLARVKASAIEEESTRQSLERDKHAAQDEADDLRVRLADSEVQITKLREALREKGERLSGLRKLEEQVKHLKAKILGELQAKGQIEEEKKRLEVELKVAKQRLKAELVTRSLVEDHAFSL
jgi:chromosome segregation ATPase